MFRLLILIIELLCFFGKCIQNSGLRALKLIFSDIGQKATGQLSRNFQNFSLAHLKQWAEKQFFLAIGKENPSNLRQKYSKYIKNSALHPLKLKICQKKTCLQLNRLFQNYPSVVFDNGPIMCFPCKNPSYLRQKFFCAHLLRKFSRSVVSSSSGTYAWFLPSGLEHRQIENGK